MSFLLVLFALLSAAFAAPPEWGVYQDLGTPSSVLNDISGLAASRLHPGILYAHNDNGDSPRIFAVEPFTGTILATLNIENAEHGDWEDIAAGVCGQGDPGYCIYIGDIGETTPTHTPANIIYKVREPETLQDDNLPILSMLRFNWSESDAKSLMVDPAGELYVISEVSRRHPLFAKLPSSGWDSPTPVEIPQNDTVHMLIRTSDYDPQGADISPNGRELLVKGGLEVYYYSVPDMDYLHAVSTQDPSTVRTYHYRPDEEAVAWSVTASGFYTASEHTHENFHFYARH